MSVRGHLLITALLAVKGGFAQPVQGPMGLQLGWKRRKSAAHDDAAAIAAAEEKRAKRAAKLRKLSEAH